MLHDDKCQSIFSDGKTIARGTTNILEFTKIKCIGVNMKCVGQWMKCVSRRNSVFLLFAFVIGTCNLVKGGTARYFSRMKYPYQVHYSTDQYRGSTKCSRTGHINPPICILPLLLVKIETYTRGIFAAACI